MISDSGGKGRPTKVVEIKGDLVIVGGGMAGVCCAITAAREGVKVILVQDRPVLGGNASSEVRLWILGATSHMGNNNRYAREGGVIDELLVENTYRNPEGNTVIFDTILLEKVLEEKNITLLLNTAAYQVDKNRDENISSVLAFCSQNSTTYHLYAPLFCDASGDGILGFLGGAAFRMGAESSKEFDEHFAPVSEYGELLGHSIYFMSKDLGKPVSFTAPSYALKDITKVPHYRKFNVQDHGCWLWWIEYGGRLDTVHETETIKWELWKVVYGVWDHLKNSGNFPEAENMTLEWVGLIPGKRESRRFEGLYMMRQSDIVDQKIFYDAVGHGGWAIDLHPADGVFSEKPSCNQWHSKGVYSIPYRSMVSHNIQNLFLTGRIISASHVAFGSTRVMATCAHNAQAVGVAAALCKEHQFLPADLASKENIPLLQRRLLRAGQYIPHLSLSDYEDIAGAATMDVSSSLQLDCLEPDGDWWPLKFSTAQMLPLPIGRCPKFKVELQAISAVDLEVSLRKSHKSYNYTPEIVIAEKKISVEAGRQEIEILFDIELSKAAYYFLCLHKNEEVKIATSDKRITGILS
ncbi:MAG: FAD-dependent oxidoreductase, partial [Saprospiraceae bacterium]|nr:FAD-dependent oxidoreductase [Saprospiraceae bacterium]